MHHFESDYILRELLRKVIIQAGLHYLQPRTSSFKICAWEAHTMDYFKNGAVGFLSREAVRNFVVCYGGGGYPLPKQEHRLYMPLPP